MVPGAEDRYICNYLRLLINLCAIFLSFQRLCRQGDAYWNPAEAAGYQTSGAPVSIGCLLVAFGLLGTSQWWERFEYSPRTRR
jgi:hypothetical protein